MSKRLTDTEKWNKNWFVNLKAKHKLLWIYLLDHCDNAGFIEINIKNLNHALDEKYTIEEIENNIKKHLIKVSSSKYWIPKFIQFQYPKGLSSGCKAHKSVIDALIKYEITWCFNNLKFTYEINNHQTLSKGLGNPYLRVLDKDKNIDNNIYINNNTNNNNINNTALIDNANCYEIKNEAIKVLNYLNQEAKRNFKPSTNSLKNIIARIKDGYNFDDLKRVINYKCRVDNYFKENPRYLNPVTLFRPEKFEIYHEQVLTYKKLQEEENGITRKSEGSFSQGLERSDKELFD